MSKQVVILVPAYRCEATILETLDSLQKQGPELERIRRVIIADDGSGDKTAELARGFWHSPVPLQVLARRFNCGEYASVNNAVEQFASDAEWFLIMHADNIAKPGWLATFLERIEEAPDDVGLIGSSYDVFAEGGPVQPGEDKPGIVTVLGTRQSVHDTLKMGCWWHISSCAIRTAAYIRVGGLPKIMQLKGDWDFMLRILADGWTIQHVPRSLMMYRDNPGGSSSITMRRHMDMWEAAMVMGRFCWALSLIELAALHGQHMWSLFRRAVGCVVRFNVIRLVWILPTAGCLFASFWTCCSERRRTVQVTSRAEGGKLPPAKP
jgi:glycosyltransferase involved in cell wall biosynthesis